MSYFDQRPQLVRLLFGILALYIFGLMGINIYKFGKSPSDENVFQDPPSTEYFIVNVPAQLFDAQSGNWIPDSIRIGDMPTSANDKAFASLEQAREYLKSLSDTALVTLKVVRPTEKPSYLYRLRKSSLSIDQVKSLQPTAWVTAVTERGASDRAGMKVGDLITRINGQTFKNVNEADQILRKGQIGKTIEYEVFRNNQLLTLHVTLASFGFPIGFLLFVISGLLYMSIGTFLVEARPQFTAARLLALFFMAIGFIMVSSPIQRGLDSQFLIIARNITSGLSVLFAPALLLHSFHYFPKERPELLKRRWIRIVGYALGAGMFPASRLLPTVGIISAICVYMAYVFVVPLFFRKEAAVDYRRMNRVVQWTSLAVGILSIAFALMAPQLADRAIPLLGYLGVALLCMPASYLYTIHRYRLMNLTLRIRRNVQYSFVSVLWTVFFILFIMAVTSWLVQTHFNLPYIRITGQSIEVVDTPPTPLEQTMMEKGFLVAIAITATILLSMVYKTVNRFIARTFHRARYDYRRAANELADVMSSTLNMTDLARGIVEKLSTLMQLKKAGVLFFRDQSACCCQEAHGFDGTTWEEFCMSIDKEMVHGVRQFSSEVSVEYLPLPLKERFRHEEFHYIISIRSKEKLVGTMLIGEKMSEAPFHHEDLEFLSSVAKQASVAIENAFLYEELAEQERLKHELAIARRIQLESLPQSTPDIAGLEISGVSVPALEVGGDYFDYLNGDPTTLTVIIGDVSGKGTSAALYMSKVQGIFRSLHGFGLGPRELFIRANHLLCKDLEKRSFITAMGAAFDTEKKQFALARAGHLPLLHFKAATQSIVTITPRGLGLGLSPEALFATELEEHRISYGVGDVLMFVTDGITEGKKQNGDEFGEERLVTILKEHSHASAMTIRDLVISEVKAFAGDASQHDDQTIVVVKVR